MKRVNLDNLKWNEQRSPKGRFHLFFREVAAELDKPKSGPALPGPPPFDLEMVRLPPGAANFPFHDHSDQWELYLIISGTGTMRAAGKRVKVKPGDCLLNPPGEAHQIINTGDEDLVYHVIANNAPTDICSYPDSKKWAATGFEKCFRVQSTGYYDGEE